MVSSIKKQLDAISSTTVETATNPPENKRQPKIAQTEAVTTKRLGRPPMDSSSENGCFAAMGNKPGQDFDSAIRLLSSPLRNQAEQRRLSRAYESVMMMGDRFGAEGATAAALTLAIRTNQDRTKYDRIRELQMLDTLVKATMMDLVNETLIEGEGASQPGRAAVG